MNRSSDMRTPLARAKGLGGMADGAEHWTAERISAVLLGPLSIWGVAQILRLAGHDRAAILAWAGCVQNAAPLGLLIALTGRHAQLGLEVVASDYSRGWRRFGLRLVIRLSTLLFVALGCASLARILMTRTTETR
ncbi:succinate dehydrogenase, hydrophobic membrane anchor protein [Asaia bogorensis]|uniref:Succinate dehydrogenase hydrophobic membrane anchor subunit n=1 Tax=Asaia bogorensis NBRC 16594 TaxID=1231624 RepID=A0AAN4R1E7_9PROT|nr:succinate dehydrogenase, hydrophobic membrane anchor protein [Asaia bogorensis]BAT18680.1 succinate dehydrogenase membrane anchor subunit [Asaia bogorensis NBRC 16594]GBQ75545.1 succinate dehydrogenase subunit D [Asaia bogorensis NBRC 16594]GEL53034.1 succinate dehydrogenase membrane anchor subunit [Asaia bogorensis NBRC 16594]